MSDEDAAKPARDVLTGTAKRMFPSEYLGHSLNEIKELLRQASSKEKRKLQTAKKLLEQAERLGEKDHGE